MTTRNQIFAALSFTVFLALLILAYWPGFHGQFYLDAQANLVGMKQYGALEYIFSGSAGPGGRPLALASFLLTPDAYPDNPAPMRMINLAIHIINGGLVAVIAFMLSQFIGIARARAGWIAGLTACLWLAQPLNSTVVLQVVQRMTSLSSMFMLAGVIFYLYGRMIIDLLPRRAYIIMGLGVTICTFLAVLSKEIGVLLPAFLLVLEFTLLKRFRPVMQHQQRWKLWLSIFLIMPTVLVIGYVVIRWPQLLEAYAHRSFTLTERLLTEPRVLLEYLQQFVLPRQGSITPFHDGYIKSSSLLQPPQTLLALVLLLLGIFLAVALRKKAPLFSFAVAWFLLGHLLESSVIALELYYEHRNYLALFGPIFAIVAAILRMEDINIRIVSAAAVAYIILQLAVVFNVSSTWGDPPVAAEIWFSRSPESVRTAQFLASIYANRGDIAGAIHVLQKLYETYPDSTMLPLQIQKLKCVYQSTDKRPINKLAEHLKASRYENTYEPVLKDFLRIVQRDACPGVALSDIYKLIESLLGNPNFQKYSRPVYNLHMLAGQYAIFNRDLSLAMYHLEKAREAEPDFATIRLPVLLLMSGGLYDEADKQFALADKLIPAHPMKRYIWLQQRDMLREEMNRVRKSDSRESDINLLEP